MADQGNRSQLSVLVGLLEVFCNFLGKLQSGQRPEEPTAISKHASSESIMKLWTTETRNGVLQCAKLCTPPAPAMKIASSTFPWMISDPTSLSDAEGTKDEVEDVVGSGGTGDFVEGAQGCVKIEEQHLVGDARAYGVGCGV
jgi:hypothetical protein